MTSKFDAAVNKILSEDWTDYIPDFLAKPEYTHGWKGRAKAAKDAVSVASLAIPGTAGVKALQGAKKGYDAYKTAKAVDRARGGLKIAQKPIKPLKTAYQAGKKEAMTGKGAGAAINRRPWLTGAGAAGASQALDTHIAGSPQDYALGFRSPIYPAIGKGLSTVATPDQMGASDVNATAVKFNNELARDLRNRFPKASVEELQKMYDANKFDERLPKKNK